MFVPFVSPYYVPEGFVPETCVSVDVAENKLLALGFEGKISLKLDHHVPRGEQPENAVIWTHSAACGELVLALIDALVGGPDKTEADLLYIAVSTDTGCFCYANTNSATFRAAARLCDAGADLPLLNKIFSAPSPRRGSRLRAWCAPRSAPTAITRSILPSSRLTCCAAPVLPRTTAAISPRSPDRSGATVWP